MQERLRQSEEHLQVYEQKHSDLEALLAQRNTSYEELLGMSLPPPIKGVRRLTFLCTARTAAGVVGEEAVAEIKASFNAQYDSKRGLLEVETSALRRRLESKDEEVTRLQDTIDSQAASIEDLNVSNICFSLSVRCLMYAFLHSNTAHSGRCKCRGAKRARASKDDAGTRANTPCSRNSARRIRGHEAKSGAGCD